MDIGSSLSNGHGEMNDAMSLYGTTKSGKGTGLINTVTVVGGQSTLSRKSGRRRMQEFAGIENMHLFSNISKNNGEKS